jgi:hypothetical protein
MEDAKVDGRLQVTAALALLDRSLLVKWSAFEMRFTPVSRETFEKSWRQIHPAFGRLMCWMLFSAGAELLAKGACLCAGLDFRRNRQVPSYPDGQLETWSRDFLSNWATIGTVELPQYGTLGSLIYDQNNRPPLLRQLCNVRGVASSDAELLLAAYTLLAKSIRNRDAHAYVPNVRDQHLSLVPELFVNCFNLLVAPMTHGTDPISGWQDSAEMLIQVLRWPTENAYNDEEFLGLRERMKFFHEDQEMEKLTLGLFVTDAGMKGINELPALKEVYLESSELTDACLKDVKLLTRLEFLHIYRGSITDAGLETLADIATLKRLRVRLGYTKITEAGIRQFKRRRRDVQVLSQ